MKKRTFAVSTIRHANDGLDHSDSFIDFEGKLLEESQVLLPFLGADRSLGVVFIILPEGSSNPHHKNGVGTSSFKGQKWIYIQRHVDYHQFLSSDEAGRLALLARALLEGVLELPKARGLKRFDARGLHEALRSFFVSKGVMELEENL